MSVTAVIQLGRLGSLGDLSVLLTTGRTLVGRVTERHGDHGLLLLGPQALVAKLPPDVEAGTRLRLRVADTAGAHVTLEVLEQERSSPAAPTSAPPGAVPPPATVPLPGGSTLQVLEDPGSGPSGRAGSGPGVTLRLAALGLGRVDLHVTTASVAVHVADGLPAALARSAAPELRDALDGAQVTVHPRSTTVDSHA